MQKLFYSLLVSPFWIGFASLMLIFHPIFLVANKISTKLVDWLIVILNDCHNVNLFITTGSFRSVEGKFDIHKDKPLIIVANHQNMYDIAFLVSEVRSKVVMFVAKKQLARGIPTVSLLLRIRNGILIDRDSGRDAISVLRDFAPKLEKEKLCCVIFPEGTRAKDGKLKPFKRLGLKVLLENAPTAEVVPVVFTKNYKFGNPNFFPLFVKSKMRIFPPIPRAGRSEEDQILEIEQLIKSVLNAEEGT